MGLPSSQTKIWGKSVLELLSYDLTNNQTDKQRLQLYIYRWKINAKLFDFDSLGKHKTASNSNSRRPFINSSDVFIHMSLTVLYLDIYNFFHCSFFLKTISYLFVFLANKTLTVSRIYTLFIRIIVKGKTKGV